MTENTIVLSEDTSDGALGRVEGKRRWRARLIRPGKGSSGFYSEELLAEDGPRAFPKGTKMHADHQTFWEREDRPVKSVKDIVGVVASDPVYESNGPAGPGLYADVEFLENWAPFVEQMHQYVGLSIQAKGVLSETETVDEIPVVEALVPYPTNSVDIVTVAGAGGQIIDALESWRDVLESEKELGMTPEQIKELGEALVAALVPALSGAISEALAPPAVESETEETLDIPGISEALIKADLPEVARKRVYSAVEAGGDIAEAIKEQKDFIDAIKSDVELSEGVVREASRGSKEGSYTVGGWN